MATLTVVDSGADAQAKLLQALLQSTSADAAKGLFVGPSGTPLLSLSSQIGSLIPVPKSYTPHTISMFGGVWLRTGVTADAADYPNGLPVLGQGYETVGGYTTISGKTLDSEGGQYNTPPVIVDGVMYCVGNNSTAVAKSSDYGVTWTKTTLETLQNLGQVAYGYTSGGTPIWVVAGGMNFDSTKIWYSYDFITWSLATAPSSKTWRTVAYGGGRFVAVSGDGLSSIYSVDGFQGWVAGGAPAHSITGNNCLTYVGGKFIHFGTGYAQFVHSTNGLAWTTASLPANSYTSNFVYFNGKYVTASATNGIVQAVSHSSDLITWTQTTALPSETQEQVVFAVGKYLFCAVRNGTPNYAYTTDLVSWTQVASSTTTTLRHWVTTSTEAYGYSSGAGTALVKMGLVFPRGEYRAMYADPPYNTCQYFVRVA